MDLSTFTLNPACPKCGHTAVVYEHKAPRHNCTTFTGTPIADITEHLVLTCTTCQYEWEMETADHDTDNDQLPF